MGNTMKKQQQSNKNRNKEFLLEIKNALKGRSVPILVLDTRWHKLFPVGQKPADIVKQEDVLNGLLKRQGFLVNDIKDLKKTKEKLMQGILSGMRDNSLFGDRKKDNQQRLLNEIMERIEKESDELTLLPNRIKEANEQLLILGAGYCFERLENGDHEIARLKAEIHNLSEELTEKTEEKTAVEESMDSAYSLMHGLLGWSVMNLYDKKSTTNRRARVKAEEAALRRKHSLDPSRQ